MQNWISLPFADGTYTFKLGLAQIDEIQRKCGVGIGEVFARTLAGCVRVGEDVGIVPDQGRFYAVDLIETIRQGLIGGGTGHVDGAEVKVTPETANRLVQNYVLDRPLSDSWSTAVSILGALIVGYEPDADKKKAGKGEAEPATAA